MLKWAEVVSKPVKNLFAMFKVREYLARSKMKQFLMYFASSAYTENFHPGELDFATLT